MHPYARRTKKPLRPSFFAPKDAPPKKDAVGRGTFEGPRLAEVHSIAKVVDKSRPGQERGTQTPIRGGLRKYVPQCFFPFNAAQRSSKSSPRVPRNNGRRPEYRGARLSRKGREAVHLRPALRHVVQACSGSCGRECRTPRWPPFHALALALFPRPPGA